MKKLSIAQHPENWLVAVVVLMTDDVCSHLRQTLSLRAPGGISWMCVVLPCLIGALMRKKKS